MTRTQAVASAPTERRPVPQWLTLAVVLTETFLSVLDFFIVNVGIPSMQHDLRLTSGAVQLVVAGFGLAYGAGMVPSGKLGDHYGRRRLFALGIGAFGATSLLCGLAGNGGELIAARVAQGVAAAMMAPQVLAILTTAFAGQARAKALAAYASTMGLAAVSGQLVGGVLIRLDLFGLGWRTCFLVNVPVAFLALALVRTAVPQVPTRRNGRLDVVGALLATDAVIALVLPLTLGQQQGWPEWTIASLAVAPVLGTAFVLRQRRLARAGRTPLVDLGLFSDRHFVVGSALALTIAMGQGSFFLLLAVYLQDGHGLSPLAAGLYVTPMAITYILAASRTPQVAARLGRQTIPVGVGIMAVSLLVASAVASAVGTDGDVWWMLPPFMVDGIGMGFVLSAVVPTAMARVLPERAGEASGVVTTAMQVGGALGVAALGAVFFACQRHHGVSEAFPVALIGLACISCASAALAQLLPKASTA